ncbi:acyltransferase family protein [Streptomyces radicis]|uniref:Acyltransferase n=1 Tax=Streptomyces radicis TaxID=1750517 RepID=A0A3A9WTQ9_9ACTN|nr:acyltransferase [Streptomyces radicis]RKN12954.1 acyltransferase [Streptomyces radicis]RKN27832.1 acyltransferase [Streptomyces radicis]
MDTIPRHETPSTQPPIRDIAAPRRLHFVDNLRVALTLLVVAHHAAQAYGPSDWWYVEDQPGTGVLSAFSAVNGSFFMSLFFFVSACLVPASVDRGGSLAFLRGRLRRLGIPFLVGALTIIPALMYSYYVSYRDYPPISFPAYYADIFLGFGERPADWTGPSWPDLQFGHLWFIQNLLVLSLLYLLCHQVARLVRRLAGPADEARPPRSAPGHRALIGFTLAVAAATFLIRLSYPLDTWVPVLEFIQTEPARLAQYAAFFAAGIVAHRRGWLTSLPRRTGYAWLAVGVGLAAAHFAAGGTDAVWFGAGGADPASACWAVYETFLCTSLCVGLLTLFREHAAGTHPVLRSMSADAFTVYIVHLPLVVVLQHAVAPLDLPPLQAFGVVTGVAVAVSFPLAAALRRLPGFRAVL